jgi:hypothetical protein
MGSPDGDFQKGNGKESPSRFGIADMISNAPQMIEEGAEKLINDMGIVERVRTMLKKGDTSMEIKFPGYLNEKKRPGDGFYGSSCWHEVVDRMVELLKDENLDVEVETSPSSSCHHGMYWRILVAVNYKSRKPKI